MRYFHRGQLSMRYFHREKALLIYVNGQAMKAILTPSILILALLAPIYGYSQELWNGAQYGMTEGQLHAIFPQAHHFKTAYPSLGSGPETIVDSFGWQSLKLDNCVLTVDFSFEGKKLTQVHIRTNEQSEHKHYCSIEIRSGLLNKYGKPNYISLNKYLNVYSWDVSDKRISIHWSDYPSVSTWTSSVTYSLRPKSNYKSVL